MASIEKAKADPRGQLLDELERVNAGMLGVQGSRSHMQPMAPMVDRENGAIWFFTRQSTDLAREVGAGGTAHFCVVGKDHDYHACLSGPISQSHAREIIDRYWNSVTSAWFEGGKDDPDLVLLQFMPNEAAVWASTGSSLGFGWEIAKANITGGQPDVGYHTRVVL